MSTESEELRATLTISASPEAVFSVLADPTSHADIDGTGWVVKSLNTERLTAVGQRFRMAMFHDQHPDKNYEMTNEVVAFDKPAAIGWKPGQAGPDGEVGFGGWVWRYELEAADGGTVVTLVYDWSGATSWARENIHLPPFGPEHLDNSLAHLADLAAARG